MSHTNYYNVSSQGDKMNDISFHKDDNGLINIHMGYEELLFTVKGVKEIIEKLKQCIKD